MFSQQILESNARQRLTEVRRQAIESLNDFNSLFNSRYGDNRIITVKRRGRKPSTKQVLVIVR